jgi:hypothetical protein
MPSSMWYGVAVPGGWSHTSSLPDRLLITISGAWLRRARHTWTCSQSSRPCLARGRATSVQRPLSAWAWSPRSAPPRSCTSTGRGPAVFAVGMLAWLRLLTADGPRSLNWSYMLFFGTMASFSRVLDGVALNHWLGAVVRVKIAPLTRSG